MSANRKLQTEIDRCMKKIEEGVELFDEIWDKVYSATQQNQKEKYEVDLKKEIKKLQRLRDQIKTWIASNDIKDKSALVDARKLIETKMEQFKVCEKETKTKTYSKEGLLREAKLDPKEKERRDCMNWVQDKVDKLQQQLELMEADLDQLNSGKGKKQNKTRIGALEGHMGHHRAHILKLEQIARLVDNEALEAAQVEEVKDEVEYYVEENQDPDFMAGYDEAQYPYEALALEDAAIRPSDLVEARREESAAASGAAADPAAAEDEDLSEKERRKADKKSKRDKKKAAGAKGGAAALLANVGRPQKKAASKKADNPLSVIQNIGKARVNPEPVPASPAKTVPGPGPGPMPASPGVGTPAGPVPGGPQAAAAAGRPAPGLAAPGFGPPPGVGGLSAAAAGAAAAAAAAAAGAPGAAPAGPGATGVQPGAVVPIVAAGANSAAQFLQAQRQAQAQAQAQVQAQAQAQARQQAPPPGVGVGVGVGVGMGVGGVLGMGASPVLGLQRAASTPGGMPGGAGAGRAPGTPGAAQAQPSPGQGTPGPGPAQGGLGALGGLGPGGLAGGAVPGGAGSRQLSGAGSGSKPGSGRASPALQHLQAPAALGGVGGMVGAPGGPPGALGPGPGPGQGQLGGGLGAPALPAQQPGVGVPLGLGALGGFGVPGLEAQAGAEGAGAPGVSPQLVGALAGQAAARAGAGAAGAGAVRPPAAPGAAGGAGAAAAAAAAAAAGARRAVADGLLAMSAAHCPRAADADCPRAYAPATPYPTHPAFPTQPSPQFEDPALFEKLGTDTLFFIFYYQQGTYGQYLAARELKRQSWRFHKRYLTWFQRHEEPKVTNDEYEQGTYVYFDYEAGWCKRIKTGFTFEYSFLEDELAV